MSRDVSRFARIDPAHVLDGLFVPVAKKGEALYDVRGVFDKTSVSFKGVQLGVQHQSILLAVAARTGRVGGGKLVVRGSAENLHGFQRSLLAQLDPTGGVLGNDFSLVECSVYALLADAGMSAGKADYKVLRDLLHDMSTVVLMQTGSSGMVGTSRLLAFDGKGDALRVSLNWRMTDALLGGQNVRVSLYERHALHESKVAKILHTWLSSFIRPGQWLGPSGNGIHMSNLLPHIWGRRPAKSDDQTKDRLSHTRRALRLISERLSGWEVIIDRGVVGIKRPQLIDGHQWEDHILPGDQKEAEALICAGE